VLGNVLMASSAFDVVQPTSLQKAIAQPVVFAAARSHDAEHPRHAHRWKHAVKLQSAAFMATLMSGNWLLLQQSTMAADVPERYCHSASQIYSVGDVIKTSNGTYRECFQDEPDTQPYWGEESRPHSPMTKSLYQLSTERL